MEEKKKVGRPKIEINEDQLEKLASILCTMEEMASFFGCSVDTLERNFADTIKKGKDKGRMSLRRLQFEKAQTGNTTMLIWLGKQMLGQKDKIETSENNEPLPWSYD
jgi:AraC-like DNA-binding protein